MYLILKTDRLNLFIKQIQLNGILKVESLKFI